MKRTVYSKSTYNENTDFLEIEVNVTYSLIALKCSSLMDINDPEFYEFEDSLLDILDMHDFNLEDAYQSDRKSSISQYYILTKTNEEGTRLRVFVKLSISDHADQGKPEHIDIILNEEHCSSYEEALTRIETKLEEFDPE